MMGVSVWSPRGRLGFGLGALMTLVASLRGLERPPEQLGAPRSCAEAQLVDGALYCDEELLESSAELCAQGPKRTLAPGDAVEPALLCSGSAPARMPPAQLQALAQRVDLNTASSEELTSLPGIGPTFAARIVARRPYLEVEALTQVRGIGPKRLAAVRARAWVSAAPVPRAARGAPPLESR